MKEEERSERLALYVDRELSDEIRILLLLVTISHTGNLEY